MTFIWILRDVYDRAMTDVLFLLGLI